MISSKPLWGYRKHAVKVCGIDSTTFHTASIDTMRDRPIVPVTFANVLQKAELFLTVQKTVTENSSVHPKLNSNPFFLSSDYTVSVTICHLPITIYANSIIRSVSEFFLQMHNHIIQVPDSQNFNHSQVPGSQNIAG